MSVISLHEEIVQFYIFRNGLELGKVKTNKNTNSGRGENSVLLHKDEHEMAGRWS